MSLNPAVRPEAVNLDQVLKYLDFSADSFGNVTLEHKRTGSKLVFTNQGDIQVHAARDVDAKTGRWYHINSDVNKISKDLKQVIYGPRGEVLRTW
jgi:hypothetical protein